MPLDLPSGVSPESTEQPDSKITKPIVLLVEGRDEEEFFKALLAHMGLKDFQVRAVGGKTRLNVDFRAFLNDPGFSRVKAYAILRDTDTDAGALTSIRDLLMRHDQPCPGRSGGIEEGSNRKVGIYLMPGAGRQGMTEDLCLEAVSSHPFMACVDRFMACLERKTTTKHGRALRLISPRNPAKARLQAFLAAMPETVPNLGLAAWKGYWPLDSPVFAEIRDFLTLLAA